MLELVAERKPDENDNLSQYLDESYFGARRGRGAAGKTVVFGLKKRSGKVYTPSHQQLLQKGDSPF